MFLRLFSLKELKVMKRYSIAVAGVGYVGMECGFNDN